MGGPRRIGRGTGMEGEVFWSDRGRWSLILLEGLAMVGSLLVKMFEIMFAKRVLLLTRLWVCAWSEVLKTKRSKSTVRLILKRVESVTALSHLCLHLVTWIIRLGAAFGKHLQRKWWLGAHRNAEDLSHELQRNLNLHVGLRNSRFHGAVPPVLSAEARSNLWTIVWGPLPGHGVMAIIVSAKITVNVIMVENVNMDKWSSTLSARTTKNLSLTRQLFK